MKAIYTKLLLFVLFLPFGLLAQGSLSGTVLEKSSGQPLPGVNVLVQGTATGVQTDLDGRFSLPVKNGDVVLFSYVGYAEQTLTYNGQQNVTISLDEAANQIGEVVVQVGYGSVRKKDATGSVAVVTQKDFVKGPVVAVDQMVQGKVAGLQVTNGGGSPGEGATIRIRSGSSLNANNDPLYVIDGVPVAAGGINGGRNPLATINQNNIESVTVLKDASATAIYGSRASNGVVIITTKKGRKGEMKVEYNSYLSVSEVGDTVDVLSASQFRDYITNNGNADQVALLGDANTDWQDKIYRTAIGTDHNIAVSGGTDLITYRASVGFANLNGILERDNLRRGTMGLNLIGNFFDNHLKVEVNSNSSSMMNDYSNRGAIGAATAFDPTQPVRNADGTLFQWNEILSVRNPVSLIEQFNNYGNSFRSIGNIQFDYKLHFFPDLKLVANLGYDEMSGRAYGGVSPNYAYPESGNRYDSRNERKNRLMDLYANYNKRVGDWLSVDLTGGYNYQDFRDRTETFNYDESNDLLIPNPVIPVRVNLQSFFGRANIGILDRYLVTLSYRRDGTSRFTDEFRWSNFPAAALAWKIKEEAFLKDSKTISDLKLRVGWGITGQQDIGNNYPSIPLYLGADQGAQYQFGNQFYIPFRPQSYNPSLKWEETETRNAGIDFGFFDNRFTGSVDVYEKRTKDLLAFVPNPAFFGFSNADNYNIGKMTNRGLEIAAQVVPVRTNDLEWTVGGNITFQDSEVTDLFLDPEFFNGLAAGPSIEGGVGNTIQNHQVGFWPNSFYVYEQAYDANGNPIDGLVIDRNGDGTISDEDRYRYKKPTADVFYGFFTNLVYKQFDFAMSWRGSWGNYMYNNVDANLGWQGQLLIRNTDLSNGVSEVLDTNFQSGGIERRLSDYYIQDASFLRMDNVTLGYTFNNIGKSDTSVRVSVAGQNLILITDYKGLDPEIASGVDNNLYPRPRIYTLGLTVNF